MLIFFLHQSNSILDKSRKYNNLLLITKYLRNKTPKQEVYLVRGIAEHDSSKILLIFAVNMAGFASGKSLKTFFCRRFSKIFSLKSGIKILLIGGFF